MMDKTLWGILIALGAVALIMIGWSVWAAAWHADPRFADVDQLAERREETNRQLVADPTWRPGNAS